jgi:hypothetical protein
MSPIQAVMNPTTQKNVYIQQANYYGYNLGKITLQVDPTGKVSADMGNSKIITIDDTVLPSDAKLNGLVDGAIKDIETTKLAGAQQSFIEHSLSEIMGSAVTGNGTTGNLFFKSVGTTTFDLDGHPHLQEAAFEVLDADAELFAADKYSGKTNDLSVMAAGVVRADALLKGKTGNIGFSDLFKALSLGTSPADGTIGFPLCRFAVYPAELRGALELTSTYAYSSRNADGFYLVTGGVKYEYDTSRAPFDFSSALNALDPTKGRVIKIWMSTDHSMPDTFPATPVYDATNAAWMTNKGWAPGIDAVGNTLYHVVATAYFAQLAGSQGVTIKDDTGNPLTVGQSIFHRPDGSEIKDWEALGELIHAKGNTIPASYNAATLAYPRRVICDGPLCVH